MDVIAIDGESVLGVAETAGAAAVVFVPATIIVMITATATIPE